MPSPPTDGQLPAHLDGADRAASLNGADRVLATLRHLAAHPDGVGLNDLARDLRSPKSSIHRALGNLRRAQFAEQDANGRYRLSYDFLRLAFSYHAQLDDVSRIRPVLTALAARFSATAHYAVLERSEVTYVAKVQSAASRVHMSSIIGGKNPAHCTALGKALLAYAVQSRDSLRDYVDTYGPLERRTPATLTTLASLAPELDGIRSLGYAVDNEESEPGITCIALPLFLTSSAHPAGAISVSALTQHWPLHELTAAVPDARSIIASYLGDVLLTQ